MENKNDVFLIKLLLVGYSGLGKTSILLRYVENSFGNTLTSIGIDFKIKKFTINNKVIKLQIWDISGGERIHTIMPCYYKGAMGLLLVFDITNRDSFLDIENKLKDCDKYAKEGAIKIMLGNKSDLDDQREVSFEEANLFAINHEIKYFETSAKDGTNIDKVFYELSIDIVEKFTNIEQKHIKEGQLNLSNNIKKSKCF